MNITQKQKGILFMILSALSFASMQVVVRMSREIPTMEQICVLFVLLFSRIPQMSAEISDLHEKTGEILLKRPDGFSNFSSLL